MNLGRETETLEFKKSTGELKEGIISIGAILNKHQKGELYFGVRPDGTPIGQEISEKTLRESLAAKKNGARCMICGAPIWAAGSAITGTNMCFTCTTGEADNSEDYEIE